METLGEAPHSTALRGVSVPTYDAQVLERRIALWVVVIPFLALITGGVLLWRSAVGRVEIYLLCGMYAVNIIGIGVGFHRHFSHRSFQTTRSIKAILAIMGSFASQGPVVFWAAVHRRHHTFSDREGDPHSPHLHPPGLKNVLRGFWHAHTGWLFSPEVYDWVLYVPDLVKDRMIMRINRLYFLWVGLGLALPAGLGYLLIGGWRGALGGLLWGGLIRIALTHHTTWSVNSICHIYGSRPYKSQDFSRNNVWMALPAFGEGWHNNHHAFPSSAFHGLHWWQVDLHAYIIRGLAFLHLAWDVKSPSESALRQKSMLVTESSRLAS
jgi:stearoyl-CoA desaturase (Delta-9 desaturase)